jgi:hypothetical protein
MRRATARAKLTVGQRLLARLAEWRERTGGADDFVPARALIVPENPFAPSRRRRSTRA